MQFLLALLAGAFLAAQPDPTPGLTKRKASSRQLECERMTVDESRRRRPGSVRELKERGDGAERSVVVCTERLMRPGLRAARDEAILSTLDDRSSELAVAAMSGRPDLARRTWLVESYYPNAEVSPKLTFATKNALMEQGLSVSDRLVTLGVGDVEVITRMEPLQAYPAACQRYFDTGSLREGDALLAIVSRDRRETALHAGVCDNGTWSWLQ